MFSQTPVFTLLNWNFNHHSDRPPTNPLCILHSWSFDTWKSRLGKPWHFTSPASQETSLEYCEKNPLLIFHCKQGTMLLLCSKHSFISWQCDTCLYFNRGMTARSRKTPNPLGQANRFQWMCVDICVFVWEHGILSVTWATGVHWTQTWSSTLAVFTGVCGDSLLTVAVLVQLYRIASSPNTFPGPMVQSFRLSFVTSTFPSETCTEMEINH